VCLALCVATLASAAVDGAGDASQRTRQHGDGQAGELKRWIADGHWWHPAASNGTGPRATEHHINGRRHGDGRPPVTLVIRRQPLSGATNAPKDGAAMMRSVFVADDSPNGFEEGDLIGCYAGPSMDLAAREAKGATAPHFETYLFQLDQVRWIDPTSTTGELEDTDVACAGCCPAWDAASDTVTAADAPCPRFAQEMPVVNEASRGVLPNGFFVGDFESPGSCRDRYGHRGVPYAATRAIRPGEEVTTCYGQSYPHRDYETVCADPYIDAFTGSSTYDKLRVAWGEAPEDAADDEATPAEDAHDAAAPT
jgi:hypothetical protein